MALLLELLELAVVLGSDLVEVAALHRQLRLQLMHFPSINLLEPGQLAAQALVLDEDVLVLVEEVVDAELHFGDLDFLATELVLELDELVLELDAQLPLVVEVALELLLGLAELLALVLQHELQLAEVVVLVEPRVYLSRALLRCEYPCCFETEL